MTEPEAEYGERLRRALHAAADSVVPSGDGLERIRSRIAHERAPDSFGPAPWLAAFGRLRTSGPACPICGLSSQHSGPCPPAIKSALLPAIKSAQLATKTVVLPAVKSALLAIASVAVTLWSSGRDRQRTGDGWMRLVFATAGAVFIVAAVTILAVPGLRQSVGVTVGLTSPNPPANPPGGFNVPTSKPIADRLGHPHRTAAAAAERRAAANPHTNRHGDPQLHARYGNPSGWAQPFPHATSMHAEEHPAGGRHRTVRLRRPRQANLRRLLRHRNRHRNRRRNRRDPHPHPHVTPQPTPTATVSQAIQHTLTGRTSTSLR